MSNQTVFERKTAPIFQSQTNDLIDLIQGGMNSTDTQFREAAFLQLVKRVSVCHVCPRMNGRTRVFGTMNGSPKAAILFVAEAPGRLGADICKIPLYGDQTGRNFQMLIDYAGIQRDDVFITNAVLCNPRDELGRNATPTACEINNCTIHLQETIEIIQPRFVVTLGSVALQALKAILPHTARLSEDVGRCIPWNGRWLIPLYHPGPRARLHRSIETQKEDFMRLAQRVSSP